MVEVPFWMKIAVPAATAVFAAMGLFVKPTKRVSVDGKDTEKITRWAYLALFGIVVTNGLNMSIAKIDYDASQYKRLKDSESAQAQLEAQEANTETQARILTTIEENLNEQRKGTKTLGTVSTDLRSTATNLGKVHSVAQQTKAGVNQTLRTGIELGRMTGQLVGKVESSSHALSQVQHGLEGSQSALQGITTRIGEQQHTQADILELQGSTAQTTARLMYPISPIQLSILEHYRFDDPKYQPWITRLRKRIAEEVAKHPGSRLTDESLGIEVVDANYPNMMSVRLAPHSPLLPSADLEEERLARELCLINIFMYIRDPNERGGLFDYCDLSYPGGPAEPPKDAFVEVHVDFLNNSLSRRIRTPFLEPRLSDNFRSVYDMESRKLSLHRYSGRLEQLVATFGGPNGISLILADSSGFQTTSWTVTDSMLYRYGLMKLPKTSRNKEGATPGKRQPANAKSPGAEAPGPSKKKP